MGDSARHEFVFRQPSSAVCARRAHTRHVPLPFVIRVFKCIRDAANLASSADQLHSAQAGPEQKDSKMDAQ